MLNARLKIAVALAFVPLVAGCENRWQGFVYPDRTNLTRHVGLGEFRSLEECRTACRNVLSGLGALRDGDYECGLNCRDDPGLPGIRVCKETSR
jgi:hypothetical protein